MSLTSDFGPEITQTTDSAGGPSNPWDNTYSAPSVGSNPLEITTLAQLETYTQYQAPVGLSPGGNIYRIDGDGTRSLIIDLRGESSGQDKARYPLKLIGFTNHFVRGVPFKYVLPSGGDVGQISGNRHPIQCNGGIGIYSDAVNGTFIDGVHIDGTVFSPNYGGTLGLNMDYFVERADSGPTQSPSAPTKTWLIQNCRLEGAKGEDDNVHGDLFHTQGQPQAKRFIQYLRIENVVSRHGQQGITMHNQNSNRGYIQLRRVSFNINNDFQANNWNSSQGAHMAAGSFLAAAPTLEDVYYRRDNESWSVFGTYYDPADNWSTFRRLYAANSPNPASSIIHPELSWMTTNVSTPDFGCVEANLGYNYSPNSELT